MAQQYKFTPVDYDPFEGENSAPTFTPVDHDPFADEPKFSTGRAMGGAFVQGAAVDIPEMIGGAAQSVGALTSKPIPSVQDTSEAGMAWSPAVGGLSRAINPAIKGMNMGRDLLSRGLTGVGEDISGLADTFKKYHPNITKTDPWDEQPFRERFAEDPVRAVAVPAARSAPNLALGVGGYALGGKVLAGATGMALEGGDSFKESKDYLAKQYGGEQNIPQDRLQQAAAVSTAVGAVNAVLEVAPIASLFDRLGLGRQAKKVALNRLMDRSDISFALVQALKTAPQEAMAEMAQEGTAIAGQFELGNEFTPDQIIDRILEAGAAGAGSGGAVGGLTAYGSRRANPVIRRNEPVDLLQPETPFPDLPGEEQAPDPRFVFEDETLTPVDHDPFAEPDQEPEAPINPAMEDAFRKAQEVVAPQENQDSLQPQDRREVLREPDRRVDAIARKKFKDMSPEEKEVAYYSDPTTGAKNLRAYEEADKLPVQISVDANDLGWYNNQMSEEAGNEMLQAINAAFNKVTAEFYRTGGDEFSSQANTEEEADSIVGSAKSLLDNALITVTRPDGSIVEKRGLEITYGIGKDKKQANAALYAAKQARKDAAKAAGVSVNKDIPGADPRGVSRRAAEGQQAQGDIPAAQVATHAMPDGSTMPGATHPGEQILASEKQVAPQVSGVDPAIIEALKFKDKSKYLGYLRRRFEQFGETQAEKERVFTQRLPEFEQAWNDAHKADLPRAETVTPPPEMARAAIPQEAPSVAAHQEKKKTLTEMVDEAIGPQAPVDKQTAKTKTLRKMADGLMTQARKITEGIPAGQPIHSTRDRNLRDKAKEKIRKASELYKQAEEIEATNAPSDKDSLTVQTKAPPPAAPQERVTQQEAKDEKTLQADGRKDAVQEKEEVSPQTDAITKMAESVTKLTEAVEKLSAPKADPEPKDNEPPKAEKPADDGAKFSKGGGDSLRGIPLTHAEMLKQGADGNLRRAYKRYVPINQLDGLEPAPTNNESDDGKYHKGTPIKQPIEVQYDQDTDKYMVYSGNHRIAQAKANGQTHILAFVEPVIKDRRYYVGDNTRSSDPDAEVKASKSSQPSTGLTPAEATNQLSSLIGSRSAQALIESGRVVLVKDETGMPKSGKKMVAYHGGPYDFDKFDTDKIGTGEGAQAYGHGLYFASKKSVAEYYRDVLAQRDDKRREDLGTLDGVPFTDLNIEQRHALRMIQTWGSPTKAIEAVKKQGLESSGRLSVLKDVESGKSKVEFKSGRLYEVDLKPSEDEYLLWDKPINEQSEKVRKAIAPFVNEYGLPTKEDGSSLYSVVKEIEGKKQGLGPGSSPSAFNSMARAASKALRDAGVRGIKYLDGSSRSKGDGDYNYVIFDASDVEIKSKYSKGEEILGLTTPDGKMYLNLAALDKDSFDGVALHEGMHSTLKSTIGEADYARLMKRMENLQKLAKDGSGTVGKFFKKGMAAIPADTKPENIAEELAAYGLQMYMSEPRSLPDTIRKWISDFIAAIRVGLMRALPKGSKLRAKLFDSASEADLVRLAIVGLRRAAKGVEASVGEERAVALFRGVKKDAAGKTVGGAFFYSPDRAVAEVYAGRDGVVTRANITFKNLLFAETWFDAKDALGLPRSASMADLVAEARAAGHDGVTFKTSNGPEYIHIPEASVGDGVMASKRAAEGSQEWARQADKNNTIPDGWYVHGRAGRQDLNTGSVIQLTKSWETADSYSGKNGSRWLIRPSKDAVIFDLSDQYSPDMEKVVEAALSDYEKGELPFLADIEGVTNGDIDESDVENAVRESFAPEDIVNSAQAYDNGSWSEWLQNRLGVDFVKTPDGAVSISGNDKIESVRVPDDKSDIRYSKSKTVPLGDLTPEQEQALKNTGGIVERKTFKQWANDAKQDLGMKITQGMVDQFAPLKKLDPVAYIKARLSKASDGALEALMLFGNLELVDGVTDAKADGVGLLKVLQKLQGEQERFFWWIAANRAQGLKAQGRENLFTDKDIAALKTLNQKKMPDGKDRTAVYDAVYAEFKRVSTNVVDIAEQSGLIDPESRKVWERDFYIPFYRVMEEGLSGPTVKSGLVKQYAFKKLKGGTEKLNADLMANVLMNWTHLLAASAKNRAAQAALEAAGKVGAATEVQAESKGTVHFLDKGQKRFFEVNDPYLLDAITALEWTGFGGPSMKALTKFKHYLTVGVTANPAFKIRNLIRDTVSAMAQSDLSYNPVKNVAQGVKAMKGKKSQTFASMLASGGLIRFGSMLEGNRSHHIQKLINAGVDKNSILDTKEKISDAMQKAWDYYNDLGDISENANRAALYEQMLAAGKSKAEAAYAARDLLDFSMGGTWGAVRFLTQTVPFMNARMQGLYKLGRAARADKKRFAAVTGAVALASIALLLAYRDDDDWKKREDWDRDNNWWFKIGDTAYRIPKPFEVGAIGTLAERSIELMLDDEMTGKRFASRLKHMLGDTFALNPTPQLFKPLIDVYANQDSFTGRPIESMGMERLMKSDRLTGRTSEVARFLGLAGDTTNISPVQIDFMIRAYFGWLGTMATIASSYGLSPLTDRPQSPEMKLRDVFLIGNFVESLPASQSRYLTQFYDQANEIEEAYASYRRMLMEGDVKGSENLLSSKGEKINKHGIVSQSKEQMTLLNAQVRMIENSRTMTKEEKRRQLDDIAGMKDRLARNATVGIQ